MARRGAHRSRDSGPSRLVGKRVHAYLGHVSAAHCRLCGRHRRPRRRSRRHDDRDVHRFVAPNDRQLSASVPDGGIGLSARAPCGARVGAAVAAGSHPMIKIAKLGVLLLPFVVHVAAAAPLCGASGKFLGSAFSAAQAPSFAEYWNKVTPENGGKWGRVEAKRDVMDWSALDEAYALAKSRGLPIQMHVLVWGNQQPAWIEDLPPQEQLDEIREWFAAVAERYPQLDFVEVVNEPLHDPPNQRGAGGGNYIEALGGAGKTGWDWVISAFRMARSYFPRARLMINDSDIPNDRAATQRYRHIVELL